MTEGNYAMIAPKGAKYDQWGTCHGTQPIILPFHDCRLNPAKWLIQLELKFPCAGTQRDTTPLFAQHDNQPYTDAHFARLINGNLSNALGATRARLYSPHTRGAFGWHQRYATWQGRPTHAYKLLEGGSTRIASKYIQGSLPTSTRRG